MAKLAKRLSKMFTRKKNPEKEEKPIIATAKPSGEKKILTAEGWKRMMLRRTKKS